MLKQDEELLEIIPLILRCNSTNKKVEGFHIETNVAKEILESMKDNSFSHLVEVIHSVPCKTIDYGHIACVRPCKTLSTMIASSLFDSMLELEC